MLKPSRTVLKLAASSVAIILVAAACGSDDSDDEAQPTTTTVRAVETTTTVDESAFFGTTTSAPVDMMDVPPPDDSTTTTTTTTTTMPMDSVTVTPGAEHDGLKQALMSVFESQITDDVLEGSVLQMMSATETSADMMALADCSYDRIVEYVDGARVQAVTDTLQFYLGSTEMMNAQGELSDTLSENEKRVVAFGVSECAVNDLEALQADLSASLESDEPSAQQDVDRLMLCVTQEQGFSEGFLLPALRGALFGEDESLLTTYLYMYDFCYDPLLAAFKTELTENSGYGTLTEEQIECFAPRLMDYTVANIDILDGQDTAEADLDSDGMLDALRLFEDCDIDITAIMDENSQG